MKVDVKALRTLYRTGKITLSGVREALDRGWITPDEYAALARETEEGRGGHAGDPGTGQ